MKGRQVEGFENDAGSGNIDIRASRAVGNNRAGDLHIVADGQGTVGSIDTEWIVNRIGNEIYVLNWIAVVLQPRDGVGLAARIEPIRGDDPGMARRRARNEWLDNDHAEFAS